MDDRIDTLAVGGLTRFSTVDYPGHLSAVVFCQGCPWRCSYCHNPHLQAPRKDSTWSWREIAEWLDSRHGLLEAVVFSGGEPLLQRGLDFAMYDVAEMGYRIGLHTTGMYPDRLASILPLVDWIGFDVKAPFDDYERITCASSGGDALRALSIVRASGVAHEVRCTVDETLLGADDGARLAKQLAEIGIDQIVLQACRDPHDPRAQNRPISPGFVSAMTPWIAQVEHRPS